MKAEVHRSIMHQHMVLGAHRECVLSLMLCCIVFGFGATGVWPRVIIAIVGLVGLMGLRALARIDPWYIGIMLRSLNMVGRFPARGHLDEVCGGLN